MVSNIQPARQTHINELAINLVKSMMNVKSAGATKLIKLAIKFIQEFGGNTGLARKELVKHRIL